MEEKELSARVLALFNDQSRRKSARVLAFSLIYRKIFGKTESAAKAQKLRKVLDELKKSGRLVQYPDIGVAEPPYMARPKRAAKS
ncbi:hypothetical protein ACQZV8_08925 [Magnetococcales bacterium HHB-1]